MQSPLTKILVVELIRSLDSFLNFFTHSFNIHYLSTETTYINQVIYYPPTDCKYSNIQTNVIKGV